MKISLNWLRNYLKTDVSNEKLYSLLTEIGLEVSNIENFESIPGGLKDIIIGKVENCKKHPNADKLKITEVNIGKKENLQIICGAPNINKNQYVLVAPINSYLHIKKQKIKIEKRKLRGVYSEGMICSEKELNISEENAGIMILKNKHKPGTAASKIINIEKDQIIDIDLTPNRNDAMSHIGVAKDLYAKLKWEKLKCKINLPKLKDKTGDKKNKIKIDIKEKKLCLRYSGVIIKNIEVKESPEWLKNKLNAIGVKTINNIVDITNFILHETGHPLHAFNLDKIKGNKIIIKKNKKNYILETLDDIKRKTHEEDLMICDNINPMCFAGIMGGKNSMVNKTTKNIFIESAYFNPTQIRKSAKRHNINSDSSFRFERGCDPSQTVKNLFRAIELIQKTNEDINVEHEIIDIYPEKINPKKIEISYNNINKILGSKIPAKDINKILKLLAIDILQTTKDKAIILIPTNKSDLYREIDITEEVARIYGYNNINSNKNPSISFPHKTNNDNLEYNIISEFLADNGLFEVLNNSLVKSQFNTKQKNQITMLNPLSLEMNSMRQSLFYGLLNNISYNLNRKQENIKIFEFGKIYFTKTSKKNNLNNYKESNCLSIMACGLKENLSWSNTKNNQIDFFWLKNITDQILDKCNIKEIKSKEIKDDFFEYGVEYSNNNTKTKNYVAKLGKVKKDILNNMRIKKDVFYAELNWEILCKNIKENKKIIFTPNSKYPEVKRDLSILIDKKIKFQEIKNCILDIDSQLIKNVDLFDVFEGNKSTNNKKSYSISIILEDKRKTLIENDIQGIIDKIILQLKNKLNIEIRM